jgi:hypothetical protein
MPEAPRSLCSSIITTCCRWRNTSPGPASTRRGARSLVQETELFLGGRVRQYYVETNLMVPPWVEFNWLAHGEPNAIRASVTAQQLEEGGPDGTWTWAIGILARELVAEADAKQYAIVDLQRYCLIPMELALMSHGGNGFLPKHLVALGVFRLRSH